MKKLFHILILTLGLATVCKAQQGLQSTTFTSVTTGNSIILLNAAIVNHQLTWNVVGSVSSCTVALDSSTNGTTWTAGGVITGQTCTSNGNSTIANQNSNYVRVNVTAFSGTGSVVVTWTGTTAIAGSGLPAGCTSPGTGQLTCTGAVTVASVTASGAGAGYFQCASGVTPSIVAGQMQLVCAAAAITGYQLIFPTTSTTGPLCSTNSANVGTLSFVSLATNTLPKGGGTSACPSNSTVVDNGTTVSTTLPMQAGGSPPTVTGNGVLSCGEATGQSVLAGADAIACNFTNHCATLLNGTVNSGCVVGSSALTVVTIGSGTSLSATLLCSTTNCPAGTYRVNVYLDMTTPCATSGTYIVWLGYTDDSGARTGSSVTTFIPINGVGSAPSTGTLTTTATANFGQGTYILRSTGAATGGLGSINYGTTATACGSAGPMVGKMYLTTERIGTL